MMALILFCNYTKPKQQPDVNNRMLINIYSTDFFNNHCH